MRSRRAQACASRARGSPSCCGKRGLSLAATPPHAERPPGRGRRGPGGPAPKAAQGPGRGGRHRASVRRRVRSAHPPIPGARLGQERGRPAHSSAGPKRQSGDARGARLGASRAHCSDQPNQTKLGLHRSPGGDRPPLWSQAKRRDPAPRSGPRQRSDPHQQGDSCRPRRAGSLAQGRVAAEIRSGAERYRGSLARPEAASPRSPDLRRTGRPRSGHPRCRQETQYRTKPPSVGQPPNCCLAAFSSPMFRHALLVGSVAMFCILSFLLYFNLDAQSPNGLSMTAVGAGLCLLPMSAGLLALALLAPLLVRRFGPHTVLTCAMMLIVIASAVIATSAADRSFFPLLGGLFVIGAGLALPYATAPRLALSALPSGQSGQSSGIVNACTFLGGSMGVTGGAIAYALGGLPLVMALLAGAALVGVVVSLRMPQLAPG